LNKVDVGTQWQVKACMQSDLQHTLNAVWSKILGESKVTSLNLQKVIATRGDYFL
jgi:hypothetical protein